MRIAIITFSCAFNYGAMLQTYGLYQFLKRKGYDVFIIDYIPERYNIDAYNYVDIAIKKSRYWRYIPFSKFVWQKTRLAQMKKNRDVFRKFLEDNVTLTHKFYTLDDLKEDTPKADVYITGSDQVWNPDFLWNEKIDKPYYLAFLSDNEKKISYAASFGKNELDTVELNAAKEYLLEYEHISVREKAGVNIISKMGLKAVEVADPTILAGKEIFSEIEKDNFVNKKAQYMLLFQITFNKELYKICSYIAKKNRLRLIVLIPDIAQKYRVLCKNKIILPSVEEWIGYFKNATYIVTDSFHGTVFSIMFERQFSSYVKKEYNGRIYNILDKTNLKERVLSDVNKDKLEENFNSKIDYNFVNMKMKKFRDDSCNWLNKALLN